MNGSGIEITKDLTIPKLFLRQCRKYGKNKVAMREKEFGIWIPFTWQDYFDNVKYLSLGMVSLGLKRGDKVAMIGDNRPEGLWAEMAAMCAGGVGVWLFQDCMMDEVKYIIDHSDSKFFVGETQEEVDKGIFIKPDCPKLKTIIWDDPKGMRNYHQDYLMSIKKVQELGKELDRKEPDLFEKMINEGHGDDVCLLFYTSGTTALPKGALLTHWNMLTMGKNLMAVDPCYDTDDFVSYLPFAWIGEQMMSISCGLQIGYTLNFPEEPETAQENIREIGPHVMFAPPRLYEGMTRQVQVKHIDSTWIKRTFYQFATKVGYRAAGLKFEKKPVPPLLKFLNWIASITVQKKLKDHLGLSRVRHCYTGGAAMGPDHFKFFHALGVNLKQIYGQTEVAGISVVHRDGDIKYDTVGTPIPETDIRISEEGEILTKSPSVFIGYYKNEEATKKTLVDGWLHSGDRGFIDEDGHLVVFDRSKDVMTLSDGRPFSPQYLETRLKFSPFVQEVWAIGDNREYVTAVMCIDYAVVGKWADDKKLNYTSYPELSQKPEVYDLVQKQIEEANKDLPDPAKIRKFVNLYKVFDADDEELTRTSKLRRAFVENRYRDIVDGLYSDRDVVHMDTTITYEDGREQHIKTDLRIQEINL
ncbi:MAG: AMP-binding protein [Deltaproteobacteria bacterium]|nr:AMP-binding protein [Deltaproteobacteria bacterium]MBW2049221.1 AMP-binding protein [Deltaproteobacteria bacterium]MBW2111947.1 AMP-binding protein [Deltaproteobacteria bacterium]MBW2353484.1 AMP-binding protein [Deltaproteobacteria bacterium]HDZ91818.1 long-chain fatty acid--CoA ligase [Deltaproteobacteria bacterium]